MKDPVFNAKAASWSSSHTMAITSPLFPLLFLLCWCDLHWSLQCLCRPSEASTKMAGMKSSWWVIRWKTQISGFYIYYAKYCSLGHYGNWTTCLTSTCCWGGIRRSDIWDASENKALVFTMRHQSPPRPLDFEIWRSSIQAECGKEYTVVHNEAAPKVYPSQQRGRAASGS